MGDSTPGSSSVWCSFFRTDAYFFAYSGIFSGWWLIAADRFSARIICHGDYHEKNIMLRDGELILIDMAKFTTGHPIFDLSVMYTSNVLVGQSHPELALKHVGMPYESALKMWELFLRAYFDGADEEQICSYNQLISGFAEYQALTSRGSDSNFPESMVPMLLEQVRGKLLPLIDQVTARPLPF